MAAKTQPQAIEVLAVDDDEHGLFALEQALSLSGYRVRTASNGAQALAALSERQPDLILLDVNMPGIDGYQVTAKIKADPLLKYIPVILVTAKHELSDIVRGLESGADDYIAKPFESEELLARLKAAWRTKQIYSELQKSNQINLELNRQLKATSGFGDIVGQSSSMRELFRIIEKVGPSTVPVLISGESGTGKELIARAIHFSSPRADKPFLIQNCSAFNDNLLESELFGHLKGSFSGAIADKIGLFEAADGGTFFLDELGEMSPALQAKLLRVLQDGSYIPVGSVKSAHADVRIIAATNRDLKSLVKAGQFREDLYYRINVVSLKLPALRERRSDIPLLIDYFRQKIAAKSGKSIVLSQEALATMLNYGWPGNVRELENEVERLAVMAEEGGEVPAELLSPDILARARPTPASGSGKLKDAVENLEKDLIFAALQESAGNKSKAAEQLGMSRSSLIAKVKSFSEKG